MVRVGIDEAGYGPRLGPLVIAAAFANDLPETPCPVPVCDSKKIYSPARGIAALEKTVLAFAAQFLLLDGLTYGKFREAVAGSIPDLPWYGDMPLPLEAQPIPDVADWSRDIRVAARVVEPEAINLCTNKADLLFEEEVVLIRKILACHPGEDAVFRIGRHGGRRFYGPKLAEAFGTLFRVEREEKPTSIYTAEMDGRSVRFEFLRDGEDQDFLLALGSMFGKYLREGAMRLFNRYWQERVDDLRPTAGYYTDGTRFWQQIEPEMERLRLSPALVLRNR